MDTHDDEFKDAVKTLARSLRFSETAITLEQERRKGLPPPESDTVAYYFLCDRGVIGLCSLPFTDIPEELRDKVEAADLYSLAIRMFAFALNPFHILTITTALEVHQCPHCGAELKGNDSAEYENARCSSCGASDFGEMSDNPYRSDEFIATLHLRGFERVVMWRYDLTRDDNEAITDYKVIAEQDLQSVGGQLCDFWNPFAIKPWMLPQILVNVPILTKAFNKLFGTVDDSMLHNEIASKLLGLVNKMMPEVPILQLDPDFLSTLEECVQNAKPQGIDPTVN